MGGLVFLFGIALTVVALVNLGLVASCRRWIGNRRLGVFVSVAVIMLAVSVMGYANTRVP